MNSLEVPVPVQEGRPQETGQLKNQVDAAQGPRQEQASRNQNVTAQDSVTTTKNMKPKFEVVQNNVASKAGKDSICERKVSASTQLLSARSNHAVNNIADGGSSFSPQKAIGLTKCGTFHRRSLHNCLRKPPSTLASQLRGSNNKVICRSSLSSRQQIRLRPSVVEVALLEEDNEESPTKAGDKNYSLQPNVNHNQNIPTYPSSCHSSMAAQQDKPITALAPLPMNEILETHFVLSDK